jgi:hypothetical protein
MAVLLAYDGEDAVNKMQRSLVLHLSSCQEMRMIACHSWYAKAATPTYTLPCGGLSPPQDHRVRCRFAV